MDTNPPGGPMSQPLPSAAEWADRLGLKRRGREWCGPCPVCGGRDRFHVGRRQDGTALVGCRGCVDGRTPSERAQAFAQVLRVTFPERTGSGALILVSRGRQGANDYYNARMAASVSASATPHNGKTMSARAATLWARAVVADSTPGATYLVERRVWPPVDLGVPLPCDCRWIPAARWPSSRVARIPQLPALASGVLVFAYRDTQGLIRAVSCEALSADGDRIEPRWRRTFGRKSGMFFVSGSGPRCYVEGECDALAARWLKPGLAGAACGGDAGMKSLRLPRQGAGAWLLPDGDNPGYDAAILAHAHNSQLAIAWRDSDGGDPAADLRELIEERMAGPIIESLEAAVALRQAWLAFTPERVQS